PLQGGVEREGLAIDGGAPLEAGLGSLPAARSGASANDAPKTLTISAVAYADPNDPRFASDPNLLRTSLREETRREMVEKAVGLYVQSNSLSQNYALLREKLLARSGEFIETVIQEDAPQATKDGLVSMSARATVKVREVQKSLNQMSREERIEFIRNNGDPKISVAINTAGSVEGAQPRRSQIAENVLKEKVQSFGFRTWAEESKGDKQADFAVIGEVKFKKLSVKLEASGLQLERTVITSWTIKCIDQKSGEEIYFNTTIPQKLSWNSEDEALADIGKLIGEEFSKNFFLQNFHFVGQKIRLNITGLPDEGFAKRLLGELNGLRNVLNATAVSTGSNARYEIDVSGGQVNTSDLVTGSIALPLNQKFGQPCFNVLSAAGDEVNVSFDAACKTPAIIGRLDTALPASLYEAPPAKREAIVRNPETLKKLSI
ncbi:MAG TPA: serine/threonine protein kinase, partial [Rhodocyclaceae bacterium]|nr:serine/threonine protein kinase [Rhodocyclaceae bacterium]